MKCTPNVRQLSLIFGGDFYFRVESFKKNKDMVKLSKITLNNT